jgi:hypothetical protein
MGGLGSEVAADGSNGRHEEIDLPKDAARRVPALVEHGPHDGLISDQKSKGDVGKGIRIFG